jgi:hypothetical protein
MMLIPFLNKNCILQFLFSSSAARARSCLASRNAAHFGHEIRVLHSNSYLKLLQFPLGIGIIFSPALIAQEQPQHLPAFRAQYSWGYASPSGEGKGVLAVLVEPSSGKIIIELHTLGERLMLLEGDASSGYRVQIPRERIDERADSLEGLAIPFLPVLQDADGLARMLAKGTGPGVKASRKDAKGPKRLRWDGKDSQNKECTVWLKRTRFEAVKETS